jgi:hypothetical protein
MQQRSRAALTSLLCAAICVTAGVVSGWLPVVGTRTEDLNRDGRPDVWRSYGRDGRIASVAVDTNFDGRSDVEEFYENGALVRRESDRDFNDRVDLIQDFDPATRQIVRSVTDVNADGVADLLVLFQNGQPVFSKWAAAMATPSRIPVLATTASRAVDVPLVPLLDPFSGDRTFKSVRVDATSDDPLWLPSLLAMPEAGTDSVVLASSFCASASDQPLPAPAHAGPSTLRGPPSPFLS